MKKHASIVKTRINFWIYSESQTTMGVGIASPPFFKMPLDISPLEFIDRLFKALDESGNVVPHPTDWKLQDKFFSEKLEMKSKKAFYSGAIYIGVPQYNSNLHLLPTANVGNKGRFDHLPSLEIIISESENVEMLFNAVQEAFLKSS